jgi:uncharacterized protein YdaU (DUF1376 family)
MPTAPEIMPLNIGDYLRDTEHLTALEDHAYFRLLLHCYARCGTLPNNEKALRRITRLDSREWRRVWPTVQLFFERENDLWLTNKRATSELAKALKYRAQQSANAKRRLVLKKESIPSSTVRESVPHQKAVGETGKGNGLTASPHLAANLKSKGWAP